MHAHVPVVCSFSFLVLFVARYFCYIKTREDLSDSFTTLRHVCVMFMFSCTTVAVEQSDFFLRNPVWRLCCWNYWNVLFCNCWMRLPVPLFRTRASTPWRWISQCFVFLQL